MSNDKLREALVIANALQNAITEELAASKQEPQGDERAELVAFIRAQADQTHYKSERDMLMRAAAMLEAQPAEQAKGQEAQFAWLAQQIADLLKNEPKDSYTLSHWQLDQIRQALLYTTQPAQPAREWVEFTEEEAVSIGQELGITSSKVQTIESKLREKNAGLPAAVPDGYALVPVELLKDAKDSIEDYRSGLEFGRHDRKLIGRLKSAMLTAAPKPQPPADDHPLMHSKPAPVFDLESLETGEADARQKGAA